MNSKEFDKIKYYCGERSLKSILNETPFPIFSDKVVKLFDNISKDILKSKNIRNFPDLASFAFYCRKKNLLQIKNNYQNHINYRSGRGLALHFTPSNVPLNFAYSLFFSLISGNVTLLRIGDNTYKQSTTFLKILNNKLKKKEFLLLKKKISIFNYEKNIKITDYLSDKCQIRIMWGGDNSINQIRESKLNPSAYELTFPDRYSICIIASKQYFDSRNYETEAINFYNDTLTFDQNACTSPRLIVWLGSVQENSKARKKFWDSFNKILNKRKYLSKESTIIQKIKSQYAAAIELGVKNTQLIKNKNVKNTEIKLFPKNLEKFIAPGGFFLEYQCRNLKSLKNRISSKLQTITTIGITNEEILKKMNALQSKGIYRIVANGRSSDMEIIWDGYEIIFHMSKRINF
ncbi:hypothetical protein OAV82_00345 [Candidatus Pelagibacter sp.]|nr:hypothetical protein [Candidatus Pelagibacter sp.]